MWNKLYIIIDKRSVKPLLIWQFSGFDIVIMVVSFLIGYVPCRVIFDEFVGMVIGVGLLTIAGVMLIELSNHLSILQHIQMWYRYNFKEPKEYFYIPTTEIYKPIKIVDDEVMQWNDYRETVQRNRFKSLKYQTDEVEQDEE